jgi:hypothetical protein
MDFVLMCFVRMAFVLMRFSNGCSSYIC